MLKKLGAAVMSFMLAAGCVYGAELEYTGGYNGVSTAPFNTAFGGKSVTVSTKAFSNSAEAENAVMLITVYKDKKLVLVKKTEVKQLSSTAAEFSLTVDLPEDITGAADLKGYEVNASVVSTDGGFAPLSGPAFYPAKEEFKPLRDLSIDGKSVDGFAPDKTEYTGYVHRYNSVEDYNNKVPVSTATPAVSALTADAATKVDITSDGNIPATVTVSAKASDGTAVDYTVSFKYYVHGIEGATADSDFEDDGSTYQGQLATSTKANIGTVNAALCTNLHGNPDSADASVSGSRWATDGTPLSGQRHEISFVAEEYAGCDYFVLSNNNRTKYQAADYELLSFVAAENVEVVIIDNVERSYEGFEPETKAGTLISGRYINGGSGDVQTAPTYDLAGKTVDGVKYSSTGGPFNYQYVTQKAFAKGETVTIKTTNTASGGYRMPIVIVRPL